MKAIETRYNGWFFRSRLEARWAVYFDSIGIKYEYEPEGYELPSGWYLPDFWLPQVRMFAEVKRDGGFDNLAIMKCKELAISTGKPCLLLEGVPSLKEYYSVEYRGAECDDWVDSQTGLPSFGYCLSMHHNYPVTEHRFYCQSGIEDPIEFAEWFQDAAFAVEAARSARF